jgi:phenylacetate-CoA ligase
MSKVRGRRDDMLVIRGVNVYPSEVEAVLLAHPQVGAHYLLVVDVRNAVPELIVCCEGDVRVEGAIAKALRERLGLRARVAVAAPETLPRTEVGKAVRVVRWHDGEPPVPGL